MMTGSKVYDRSEKEVDIQQEAQITMNLLNDMLIGATKINYKTMNGGMPTEIHMVCYKKMNEMDTKVMEFIIWLKEKRAVYVITKDSSFVYDGTDSQMLSLCSSVNEETDLLGSNVIDMEVDCTKIISQQVLEIRLDFELGQVSFENSKVIKLRNKQG